MRFKHLLFITALILCGSFGLQAQLLNEGFETGTPPSGWLRLDNGNGTSWFWQGSTIAYAGDSSAFIRYENVTSGVAEDWLITPAITMNATDTILSFWQRQNFGTDYGSVYTVRVSTDSSQSNTTAFQTIFTQNELDFGTSWSQVVLGLGAYTGQTIYIAFVMTNDDGDNWYIDDVKVDGAACEIVGLAATNITQNSADITWTSSANSNEVEIIPAGATPTGSGVVTGASPYAATGLMPITDYDVYARSLCIGGGPDTLMITGAFDGPLPGGQPKGVELLVLNDIPDLSRYGISSANNGSGTTAPNPEYIFPAVSVSAGDYIYVTADSADFITFFGFSTPYITNAMLINGDDAVELFKDSVVVDVFGDVNTDGTGTPWDYRDGWAYRTPGQTPSVTFVDSLWIYSGTDQLEGGTTNATCTAPFPLQTYAAPNATPSPWVGPITFTTLCAPITSGDNQGTAIMVPSTSPVFADSGNTVCYTDTIGNGSNDVWYMVVMDPCATSVDVSLCGSDYDTFLRLFDTGLNSIATNDDACGLQSEIIGQSVSGGDTIFVVVEGFSTNNGAYLLNITQNISAPNAAFNYPAATFCLGDPNPMATITGDSNGVFTSTAGLALDTATGMINLGSSTPGQYDVLYTVGQSGCFSTDTVAVTLAPQDTVGFSYAQSTYCQNDSNPLPVITGDSGTFAAPTGMAINASTGEIDLAGTVPGTYAITLNTSGACPASDSVSITVAPADTAIITYATDSLCSNDPALAPIIAGAVGVFNSPSGLAIDTVTGVVDPSVSTPGTYSVTYTTGGACPTMVMNQITISPQDDASFSYANPFFCQSDSVAVVDSLASAGGAFSSTTGLVIDPISGTIDLVNSPVDSFHVVIHTTVGPCPASDTISLGVLNCAVGIDDAFAMEQFKLFPVPNQGRFFLENTGAAVWSQVEVMDLTGRVMLREEFDFFAGDKREIVLDNAAAGSYFLRVRTEDGVQTLRFQVAY